MTENNNAQAIIDTAQNAVEPWPASADVDFYIARGRDGEPKVIDMIGQRSRYHLHPRRIIGHPSVYTHQAFEAYVSNHRTSELEVWADDQRGTVVAVFDSHDHEHAGWGEHRLTLQLRQTPDWQTWTGLSGKMIKQVDFAEFIEDNIDNIVNPSSADMLELAQSFQANSGVTFESSKFLDSGHRQLEYRESVEAKAGRRGQLEIPNYFELALQPYIGLDTYRVKARFRYRINDGDLLLGYKLDRPDDVLRTAFTDTVEQIGNDLDIVVLNGRSW